MIDLTVCRFSRKYSAESASDWTISRIENLHVQELLKEN